MDHFCEIAAQKPGYIDPQLAISNSMDLSRMACLIDRSISGSESDFCRHASKPPNHRDPAKIRFSIVFRFLHADE